AGGLLLQAVRCTRSAARECSSHAVLPDPLRASRSRHPRCACSNRLSCKELVMSRKLNVAVAQMGPVHLADTRESVVRRLVAMLRESKGRGAQFVVFPELALTTFFPRYWMTE